MCDVSRQSTLSLTGEGVTSKTFDVQRFQRAVANSAGVPASSVRVIRVRDVAANRRALYVFWGRSRSSMLPLLLPPPPHRLSPSPCLLGSNDFRIMYGSTKGVVIYGGFTHVGFPFTHVGFPSHTLPV